MFAEQAGAGTEIKSGWQKRAAGHTGLPTFEFGVKFFFMVFEILCAGVL